jgi:hypothetical protein
MGRNPRPVVSVKIYRGFQACHQSKPAKLLFTYELAVPSSATSQNVDTARWLWSKSEELTGLQPTDDHQSRAGVEGTLARIVQQPDQANHAVL